MEGFQNIPVKILQVNASYKPAFVYGGPTISVSKLSEMLSKSGQSIEVLTTTANGKADFAYENGAVITIEGVLVRYFKRITKDNSHFSPSLLRYFDRMAKSYSIIHIHAWWNLVSVCTAVICWKKGRRFIFSPRGTLGAYSFTNRSSFIKRAFHYLIGRRVLRNAIFQVSSTKEARDIKTLFPLSQPYVIPNFVDLIGASGVVFKKREATPFKLLFFSRIEEKKGLEFLFAGIKSLQFPYILNIWGEGNPAYIESLKNNSAANKNIIWQGAVYGNKKFEVFADHDLLILPSFDENFANVVIEALAVGTPSLLSENVGVADYVKEKALGWTCPQESGAIGNTLNEIYLEKEKLTRIREDAPGIIKKDFHESKLTQDYLHFYGLLEQSTFS